MLVDAHCHLQDRKFGADMSEVIERAREAGVTTMVTIGYDMPSSERAIEIAAAHADIYATVGVHPHDAKTVADKDLARLREMAAHEKVVAIGEIGLDFYRNLSPREEQYQAFRGQLEVAHDADLPVVIHSRDADGEAYAVIAAHFVRGGAYNTGETPRGVMHCYAGDLALAERYIALGFAISIAGTVTYPAAEKAREVAANIPLEWMTVETDAPYLPPQSIRGQRNEPARVADVARYVTDLRGEAAEEVSRVTAETAARLFRIG
jgi:TatD DNase family protein